MSMLAYSQKPMHLFVRGGRWYFRLRLGERWQQVFGGMKEMKVSLKTTDRQCAIALERKIMTCFNVSLMQELSMAKDDGTLKCFLTYIQTLADGTAKQWDIRTDPLADPVQEHKLFEAFLAKHTGTPIGVGGGGTTLSLSELIRAYIKHGHSDGKWRPRTETEVGTQLDLFLAVVGDVSAASINRAVMERFKETIRALPANRKTKGLYKDKTIEQLVALGVPEADQMSDTTVNKHIANVTAMLNWSVQSEHTTRNPASGLRISMKGKRTEAQLLYSDEDVRRLIEETGKLTLSWQRFIPLLLAHTGARLNEVCQLHCTDVVEVDGIPCINIDDSKPDQGVKNATSRRTVPLHPDIAGPLLAHVEAMRAAGQDRVWPELKLTDGSYRRAVTEWYRQWKKTVGLTPHLHSLRHTFTQKLREANVSTEDIADIVGHKRGPLMTQTTYMKQASAKRLMTALSKLSYDAPKSGEK